MHQELPPKDKNGNPIISLPSNNFKFGQVKIENDEHARNILKQESVIESLRDDYENAMRDSEEVHGANKQLKEALEVLHSKLAIAEHTNMELKKKIDTEAGFYAASETTLKNSLSVLQADNETLKETPNNLDYDFKKKSTDFLAHTKKLHTEHLEHQKIVKQLNDFREPLILEERKLRREEKASRKQKAKAKQEKTKSDVSEDPTLGDDDFHCTICAQTFPKSELSSKSVPEESDTCKTCNNHEFDTIETLDEELEPEDLKPPHKVINQVQTFWNGDGYRNNRLAIAYINMCNHSHHDCDQCKYISVMNEGTEPGRTGGWNMQFCHKFNFKLGDPYKEPPYILD